ncbi:MAG TPA: hypothetical protein VHZ55_04085 [Bryobacteraceae bacterium]|nr:hypothetical protein [Bryobacteraceae bacterium]
MKKDPAAVALARKRWDNASDAEREEAGRRRAQGHWDNASKKERAAVGAMLAAARAAARKKRGGKNWTSSNGARG